MSDAYPFKLDDQMLIMEEHEQSIRNVLGRMETSGFVGRFWSKDAKLWQRPEGDLAITGTMGWLDVALKMKQAVPELESFAAEVRSAGFERVVLAGMGGSSLAPLVLAETLGRTATGLPLSVLDSTDPATVLRIERLGPVEKALFIIASKSGGTAEPTAYDEYFYEKVSAKKKNPGENFVAISDPGTVLEKSAAERQFRRTFLNFADIGGRFSALSYFGMVPAALMGINLDTLLDRALAMANLDRNPSAVKGPGIVLGATLGELQRLGIDKLTFIMPKSLQSLGLWLEQLIAESTGKEGKGILPIAGEEPGAPSEYGKDRVFAYIRPRDEDCTYLDMRIAPLRDEGWPVIHITLHDFYDVAREFMRWEIATAVAGSIIGINPFDQPNVQESKDVTKKIIAEVEQAGSLPGEAPTVAADGIEFFGDVQGHSLEEAIYSFLEKGQPGDYVSLMAYLTETSEVDDALTKLQRHTRDCTNLATTLGYGPRFLHSTGQFHKGGPNGGHFIQLTQDDAEDAPLPGRSYSFGTFRNAQALGDRRTLEAHGRRVIRIHLGTHPVEAIQKLIKVLDSKPMVARH
jgi:transaldolase/glucose-6-phosphate isomerase